VTDERRNRVPLKLPTELVKAAGAMARARGDVLTDFVHAAVIAATKAAEAGHGEQLPPRTPRTIRDPAPKSVIHYTASREQASRCAAALAAVGSSVPAVVAAALQAYLDADGVWLDTRVPGEPDLRVGVAGRGGPAGRATPEAAAGAA
jgi:hypothetical protein